MTEFKDYRYERVDFGKAKEEAEKLIADIKAAADIEAFDAAFMAFNRLYAHVVTYETLCSIRHTSNTADEFYAAEQEYYDNEMPAFMPCFNACCQALLESPLKDSIAKKYGEHLITIVKTQLASFDPVIIEDMQKENALANEYQKIMASAVISFRGEEYNLPGLMKFMQDDPDRATRKEACAVFDAFLAEKEPVLDELYDKLVKIRTSMGKKMGYENFEPLGYLRMNRYDYDKNDVEKFRKQVKEELVPICSKIREKQAQRIGVEKLKFYDNWYLFTDGNPKPAGGEEYLTKQAMDMYADLSPQTKEFFSFMTEHKLLDLQTRKGKAMGGYCTYMPDFKSPFIFSNFNGTSADADVLTHEAGHAFNAYCLKDNPVLLYSQATLETCEIHSTSMEFFAHKYMDKFFGKDKEKYFIQHLADTLSMIPYEIVVDEFQHIVYENPDMTPNERKAAWRKLEKEYLPHIDYDGNATLEKGTYWLRQLHIFMDPFYYIDYALAGCGALEYYGWMQRDRKAAWESYYKLCCLGGSKPYRSLLKEVGLSCPFEEGSLKNILEPLKAELGI